MEPDNILLTNVAFAASHTVPLEVGEFVHVIADAHIYDRHVDIVKELIERPKYAAPKLVLNPKITDFYKFTLDDINLEGYEAGPKIKGIPVAV